MLINIDKIQEVCKRYLTIEAQAHHLGISKTKWASMRFGLCASGLIPKIKIGTNSAPLKVGGTAAAIVRNSKSQGKNHVYIKVPKSVIDGMKLTVGGTVVFTLNKNGTVTMSKPIK